MRYTKAEKDINKDAKTEYQYFKKDLAGHKMQIDMIVERMDAVIKYLMMRHDISLKEAMHLLK